MLRVVTNQDLLQLAAIEQVIQKDPWTQSIFAQCLQAHSYGWVIEHTAQIIGFILLKTQADECHILNFGVAPAYQCQGYGRRLLLHALAEAQRQGVKVVYLEVRCSNCQAIRLYEKNGFKKIGERKQYYLAAEGREDAWVFSKAL